MINPFCLSVNADIIFVLTLYSIQAKTPKQKTERGGMYNIIVSETMSLSRPAEV